VEDERESGGSVVVAPSGEIVRSDAAARGLLDVAAEVPPSIQRWVPEFPASLWHASGRGAVVSALRTLPPSGADGVRTTRDLLLEVMGKGADGVELYVLARQGAAVDSRSLDGHFDATSRVIGELTHELSNPLTSIIASLDTALDFEVLSAEAKSLISGARAEVLRVAEIVSRARRQTRRGEPDIETVDVASLLDGVLGPLRASLARGRVLEAEVPHGLTSIRTDPFRFKAMFVNLVVNARDAIAHSGSRIRVRLDRLDEGEGGRWLALTVQDDGVGMTRDTLLRAGNLLFTTKKTGSGIGLANVRSTVASFGGSLLLSSTPGRGTLASVLLPER